jgi:hypothetical protein
VKARGAAIAGKPVKAERMSMAEFRRMAASINRCMQQVAAEGITGTAAIIERMMVCLPDFHTIWHGASDDEFMMLVSELPGFRDFAKLVEEAFEDERRKVLPTGGGLAELSDERKLSDAHREWSARLLNASFILEQACLMLHAGTHLPDHQPKRDELGLMHKHWLSELDAFRKAIRAEDDVPRGIGNIDRVFDRLAARIHALMHPRKLH